MMNIKTIVVRAAKRVQRLVRVILGIRAVSVSPAAAQRRKAATIAPQHAADADAPTTDGINVGSGSPQAPTAGRRRRKHNGKPVSSAVGPNPAIQADADDGLLFGQGDLHR
jgi:hypothetical protein